MGAPANLSGPEATVGLEDLASAPLAQAYLTRARLDYLNAVAEYNKAQYATQKAIGGLSAPGTSTPVR